MQSIKTMVHKQERMLVQSTLTCLEAELKTIQELNESLVPNPRYIHIRAQVELCRKLLGKR